MTSFIDPDQGKLPGLVINYPQVAQNQGGRIEVVLFCNSTAPATPEVDFFVSQWEYDTVTLTGYSYFGRFFSSKKF